MSNPTISQVTKCVKRNKQNVKINLNNKVNRRFGNNSLKDYIINFKKVLK